MITEKSNKPITILVCDDNQSMRSFIIGYLAAYFKGQTVTINEVSDGAQAVAFVAQEIKSQHSVDLIIMDYEMPVLNGKDAIVNIRELERLLPGEMKSRIVTWSSAYNTPLPGSDIALLKRFSPFDFAATMKAIGFHPATT